MSRNTIEHRSTELIFVGNGSYANRGCEAIVRGTMEILRKCIPGELTIDAGSYGDPGTINLQAERETDSAIGNFRLLSTPVRWSRAWWEMQANNRLGLGLVAQHAPLAGRVKGRRAALEIGGDNYSLDYGLPRHLISMDRYLESRSVPVIVWGASIGPFDAEPEFKKEIFSHLRTLPAIFVRESRSYKYLADNGISKNLHLVADPAFMMESAEPAPGKLAFNIPEGCIGLNFSPLVGKSFLKSAKQVWELTENDLIPWFEFCVACVVQLSSASRRPILLMPHVGSSLPGIDDFAFLERVRIAVAERAPFQVLCIDDNLNAAESKWVISKCSVFAGARTHATIAGLSTHVPTLSFGYSVKAQGINEDIYGSLDHCLDVKGVQIADIVTGVMNMLDREKEIRKFLETKVPQVRENALSAGRIFNNLINS